MSIVVSQGMGWDGMGWDVLAMHGGAVCICSVYVGNLRFRGL